ncbi:S8 family peptidase [Thiothrix caldifontis]|nr:S8 family peptidase [Thiothrix caldifontis]
MANNKMVAAPSQDQKIKQLIIKLRPNAFSYLGTASIPTVVTQIAHMATAQQPTYKRAMSDNAHVLTLPYEMTLAEAIDYARKVKADANVEYADPDIWLYPSAAVIPNDTYYSQQWHYGSPSVNKGAANLLLAWGVTKGSNSVVVAVVDTGSLNHVDLNSRFIGGSAAKSGYDFISDVTNANDGNGRDANPSDPGDWTTVESSSWHGTHVAGTIAAESNNSQGVTGVDWNARVLTARVLGKNGGSLSDIADAIRWSAGETVLGVVNPNPARVINMSLGGSGACFTVFQNAINAAVSRGATVVVAAGNSNVNASNATPANCKNVVAVAAVDKSAHKASFSNYGSVVDIAAPGVSILSTLDGGTTTPKNNNIYQFYQGTSMAAPHVSGVASLMLGANINLRNDTIPRASVPVLLEAKLRASARPFPSGSSCVNRCGAGLLDAYQAVLAVTTKPVANAGSARTVSAATTVILNGSATDDSFGGQIKAYLWTQVSGTPVTLSSRTIAQPRFTAPTMGGVLRFSLVATDDTALVSDPKYVDIIVTASSTKHNLTVTKSGTGNGTVASNPAGINCGTACVAAYTPGTNVTLTATPASGSVFIGWSGVCTGGASTCTVSMSAAKTVKANFQKSSACQSTVVVGSVADGVWQAGCTSVLKGSSHYGRYHTFTLSAAKTVTIDLVSARDTYLVLRSGGTTSGGVLVQDDDGGSGFNSRIVKALSAGTYTIESTTAMPSETGAFSLILR